METQAQIDLFSGQLKEALEKKDFEAVGEVLVELVGSCMTAKLQREDQQHHEIVEQLAGIRDALELGALVMSKSTGVVLPLRGRQIETKILARAAPSPTANDAEGQTCTLARG